MRRGRTLGDLDEDFAGGAALDGVVGVAGAVEREAGEREAGQVLSFLSSTAVLGTPMDVTLDEMAIESFYPADAATVSYLASSGP